MNEEKKEIIKLKFERFILSEAQGLAGIVKELTKNKETYIELLDKIEYLVKTQDEEEYKRLEQQYQNNNQWEMAWELFAKWVFLQNKNCCEMPSEIN